MFRAWRKLFRASIGSADPRLYGGDWLVVRHDAAEFSRAGRAGSGAERAAGNASIYHADSRPVGSVGSAHRALSGLTRGADSGGFHFSRGGGRSRPLAEGESQP